MPRKYEAHNIYDEYGNYIDRKINDFFKELCRDHPSAKVINCFQVDNKNVIVIVEYA